MPPTSILIVGCGIGGPVLASFLLLSPQSPAEKPQITILERSSRPRSQGQNIDIRGAGLTIVRKLGLEGIIRSSTTNEEGARFVDEQNRIWGEFGADKTGKIQTGTSDIEILRGTLAKICLERSESVSKELEQQGGKGIEYIFGDSLGELEQDGQKVHVRFAKSGERRSYDLVVGSDGLQSQTRRMAFGEEDDEDRIKRLGMYAGFFSMPRSETDSLWRRWFHAPGRRGIMVRPGETEDMSTALIYVINEEDGRLLKAATSGRAGVEEQKALIKEYFQDAGWECPRLIREMYDADDFYYDMVAQVRMDKWSRGRVVLLGDAGYCGSPISGMGTTLALSGAYNLAGALTRHPDDYTVAFAEYEKKMRPTVERAQKLAPGAPHIINPETGWGIWIMRRVLYTIWSLKVDRLIARFAGAPANEVPVEEYGFRSLPEVHV